MVYRILSEHRCPKCLILPLVAGQLLGALRDQTRRLPSNGVCSAALQRQQAHTAGGSCESVPHNTHTSV